MREICNGFSEINQLWILRMFSRDLNFSEISGFLCLFSYVVIHVFNAGHLVLFCFLVAVDATKIKMNGQALLGMLPESSSCFTFLRNAHRGCTRIHPHLFILIPDPSFVVTDLLCLSVLLMLVILTEKKLISFVFY